MSEVLACGESASRARRSAASRVGDGAGFGTLRAPRALQTVRQPRPCRLDHWVGERLAADKYSSRVRQAHTNHARDAPTQRHAFCATRRQHHLA